MGTMNIQQMAERQAEFDRRHGWSTLNTDDSNRIAWLKEDLIGLVGEIGELANEVKKLTLESRLLPAEELASLLKKAQPKLADELIDTFIYLLRLATTLNVDLEKQLIEKQAKNEARFKRFENP
jgi:NTP pyrophosphatase (non-canonical NTP hydrolase)